MGDKGVEVGKVADKLFHHARVAGRCLMRWKCVVRWRRRAEVSDGGAEGVPRSWLVGWVGEGLWESSMRRDWKVEERKGIFVKFGRDWCDDEIWRSGLDEEGSDVGGVVLMEEAEDVCLRVQMFGMG